MNSPVGVYNKLPSKEKVPIKSLYRDFYLIFKQNNRQTCDKNNELFKQQKNRHSFSPLLSIYAAAAA